VAKDAVMGNSMKAGTAVVTVPGKRGVTSSVRSRSCNDPLKTCSGRTIGENSHGYVDGRRNQEMDGQAQSGIGGGSYSRIDLDLRGFKGI
jgi:hypothetical protein